MQPGEEQEMTVAKIQKPKRRPGTPKRPGFLKRMAVTKAGRTR